MKQHSTPSSSAKRGHRNRPLLFFVLLAVLVVCVGYWYQQQHATPIEAQDTPTAADSLKAKNLADGEAFLANKAKEAGVKTLGAGLLYKELKSGAGTSPTGESTVKVNYEGRLIDGTVFDSSYQRGEAAEFPVSGVVSGWQVALKAMKPGAVWEVYIPYYMAYGEAGSGSNIPPCAALVFKIELLEVK